MAGFEIRPATADDQPAIRRIVRAANINPAGLDWPKFLVATGDRGAVIGVAQVKQHRDGSRELASVAVVPEQQRQGAGSALIRALLVREDGTLHLTCRAQLEGYYARFGFRRIERRAMPPNFRRRIPAVNAFLRPFGIRLIVMQRSAGP
jgi:N-acetylglutamate synthase-like GNAT family acetyltransferase